MSDRERERMCVCELRRESERVCVKQRAKERESLSVNKSRFEVHWKKKRLELIVIIINGWDNKKTQIRFFLVKLRFTD